MNSSAWDKFRKQQTTEREQPARLPATMQPLPAQGWETAPTDIELSALVAALHSVSRACGKTSA